jgi:(2Fe-2S) ferredoxin
LELILQKTKPFFEHHIFCCTNERDASNSRGCCASKGASELRDYMKLKVKVASIPSARVNNAGCLDRCEHGPTMVIYPEGIWYSCKTKADVDEIIESHLKNNKIVERLVILGLR